jgi:shikimate kinase
MSDARNIVYLTGFMGSGKTTTGMSLALQLGWSFMDLDTEIENFTGKTIPEIFLDKGEPHFRDVERKLLLNLSLAANTVVSTGGGTPCYSDNMDFMQKTGLTVYLRMTPEKLRNRLSASKDNRPLIKDLDNEKLLSFIREKLSEREVWYERSDIIVDGSDPDIGQLSAMIRSRLNL